MNTKEEFALGPGRVYIAGGRVDEEEMSARGVCAGVTEGGCALVYSYRTKELLSVDGEAAGMLRFGETVTVKGRLCRIGARAMELITGGTVSVLLECPLPDGDVFTVYLRGGIPTGVKFTAAAGGGLDFELTCGRGLSHPRLRMKGGTAS